MLRSNLLGSNPNMNQALDKIRENDQQNLQKNLTGLSRNIMGALGPMGNVGGFGSMNG